MLPWEIAIGIALCLAFVIGIVGNISVCVVILLNVSLHTTTNCYLFSLAVSDLLIIIGDLLPWIFNWFDVRPSRAICVLHLMGSTFGTYITLLTIAAVSITRYIVICHPFIQHRVHRISKTIEIIVIIWIMGSFVALPQTYKFMDHCNQPNNIVPVSDYYKFVTTLIYFIMFLIVIIIIGILYFLIYRELKRSCHMMYPNEIVQEENKKVTRILVTIFITLFICWTPIQVCQLVIHYTSTLDLTIDDRIAMNDSMRLIEGISGFLFFVISTTINPFIYNILSDQFREAFKRTFGMKRKSQESISPNCTNEEIGIDSKSA